MKVFAAWSGNASYQVAEILRDWLPTVLPFVKVWVSEEDIAKGTQWRSELWKNLKSAKFGILCLVPGNVTEPWVIFEAGALAAGRAYEKVSPFLVGIEPGHLPSPLKQFQCTRCEKRDVKRLVRRLNEVALPESVRLSEEVLTRSFNKEWPRLRAKLRAIDLSHPGEETQDASQDDGQSTAKELELDDVHVGILRAVVSSPTPASLTYLEGMLNRNRRLIIVKVNDLINRGFVKRVGGYGSPRVTIENEGVRFLDRKGLL